MKKQIGVVSIFPAKLKDANRWDSEVYDIFSFVLHNIAISELNDQESENTLNILAGICSWNKAGNKSAARESRRTKVIDRLKEIPKLTKGPEFHKLVNKISKSENYIGKFSGLTTGFTAKIRKPKEFIAFLYWASELKEVTGSIAEELRGKYRSTNAFKNNSSKLSQLLNLTNPDCFVVVNKLTAPRINKSLARNLTTIGGYLNNLPLLYNWGLALVGKREKRRMQLLDRIIYRSKSNLNGYYKKALEEAMAEVQKLEIYTGRDQFEDPCELDIDDREGRVYLRKHLARERSTKLVSAFKRKLKKFNCKACGFDFEKVYGNLGRKFIEAHHTMPLAHGGERRTSSADFVAVCSNCHRMIHRRNPQLTIAEMRTITGRE